MVKGKMYSVSSNPFCVQDVMEIAARLVFLVLLILVCSSTTSSSSPSASTSPPQYFTDVGDDAAPASALPTNADRTGSYARGRGLKEAHVGGM